MTRGEEALPVASGARAGATWAAEGAAIDVARLAAEVDWEAALPPRAHSWPWRAEQAVKRVLDVGVAFVALVGLGPVFLVLAVLIVVDSGFPVLYPWRVVGYRGRRFTGFKFRTMVRDADRRKSELLHLNEMNGPVFKMREDPRVTRLGRFLRRFSLDELPQLWSVVRGDMSLVGPHPMFANEFAKATPWQRRKLAVRPGITCLWQVSGRSEIRDFDAWVRLDLEYIQRWSLWLDLKILCRTIPTVLSGRGAH